MLDLHRIQREIKVMKISMAKFFRRVKHSVGASRIKKTSQDRMLLKLVRSLLENDDMHVFFSPISAKVYVHSANKEIVIIYDLYKISITNHKFFFTSYLMDGVGEEIINIAKARIEREMSYIDKEVSQNETNFLNDVYQKFNGKDSLDDSGSLGSNFLNHDKINAEYLDELMMKR